MTSHSAPIEDLLGPLSPVARQASPGCLYFRGRRELLDTGTRIAVVGSRNATAAGLSQARQLTQELAESDVTVVSGLALGIDTVAHQTAIECGAGTIAVLGTSLDRYATHQNRQLQDQIGQDHLLLSQFPDGTQPQRHHFPQRNKVMALVADATIIVEATESSGTRHQGWEAIRLGRPVLFPQSLMAKAPEWSTELVKYGAIVLDQGTLAGVLDEIPYRIQTDSHEESFDLFA